MSRATQGPLGPALRKFRQSRSESGKVFAEAAGMSQGHLSEIETGRRNLTATLIERIASSVGMKAEDLLDELEELSASLTDLESITLREEPTPYNVRSSTTVNPLPPDEYKDLAAWFVGSMSRTDAWELVRTMTKSAEAGDVSAARCARALLTLLTEPL